MRKHPHAWLLLPGLMLAACLCAGARNSPGDTLENYLAKNGIRYQKTPEGICYTIERQGQGELPRTGSYVMVHYTGRLLNGKVFDRSAKDAPFVFQLGYRQVIEGWDKGVARLKVGTKATLYIPAALGYGAGGVGATIPPNSPLVFELEIVRLLTPAEYDQYMADLEKKERQAFEAHQREQLKKDKKIIQQYAIDHKIKAKRLDSGLSYAITREGKGDVVKTGDLVSIHYEGYLANDRLFDASRRRNAPFTFEVGKGKAIEGLEQGVKYFNKGAEGWLLVPSHMAYGPRPIDEKDVSIPADAVLIFKLQVTEVRKKQQD